MAVLIPGGYFQGTEVPSPPAPMPVPCMQDLEIDQVANTFQSFTVHPGLPGENGEPTEGGGIALPLTPLKSFVDAWAVNGGGGDATSLIFYAIVDAQTGQIDPHATIAMTFNGGDSLGTDGFKFYDNAGYDLSIGPGPGDPNSYVYLFGGENNQDPGSFCNYFTKTVAVISSSPDCQATITFQSDGVFQVYQEAYANDTSVAWLDPNFTVLNPDDVLIGSPFEGDPNTPLFTAAQLRLFQSFDIDISGIPSPTAATAIPEPSTGPLLAACLVLLTGAACRSFRKWT